MFAAVLAAVASACVSSGNASSRPTGVERADINPDIYLLDGIEIARYDSPRLDLTKPPIVLVHGGGAYYGAWAWMAERLSETGRTVYAFSWRGHGGSDPLPPNVLGRRSILDVARDEVPTVTRHALDRELELGREYTQIDLAGRSMGGAAALAFAASNPNTVRRLAVLNAVVPAEFAPADVPVPIEPYQPSSPGGLEDQRALFYPTLPDDQVEDQYLDFNPTSSKMIFEATRWTLDIDTSLIQAEEVLALASDPALDFITPPSSIQAMAAARNWRYEQINGAGHSDVMLQPGPRQNVLELLVDVFGGASG